MIKKQVSRERGRGRGSGRDAVRELKTIQQIEINEAKQSTDRKKEIQAHGQTDTIATHTHTQGLKKEDAIPNPQRYSPFLSEN